VQQIGSTPCAIHFKGPPNVSDQAADGAGAKGVGVTTGIYSQDDLAAASPNSVVLAGLDDVPQVLEALGLDW